MMVGARGCNVFSSWFVFRGCQLHRRKVGKIFCIDFNVFVFFYLPTSTTCFYFRHKYEEVEKRFYATFDSGSEMRMRFLFYFFLPVLWLYLRLSSYEYFYLSIQLTRDINCALNIVGWFVSLQSDLFDFRFAPSFKSPKTFGFLCHYCYYHLNHRISMDASLWIQNVHQISLILCDEKRWQFFCICLSVNFNVMYICVLRSTTFKTPCDACCFWCDQFLCEKHWNPYMI